MNATRRVVVKVGGSLVTSPNLPGRLKRYLIQRWPNHSVGLLFGGGPIVDALRTLDQLQPVDAIEMHWRAVRAMRFTFEMACQWLADADAIGDKNALNRWLTDGRTGWAIIAADSFYSQDNPGDLPQDWGTTSDSIAALLARRCNANQLELLKACEITEGLSPTDATLKGITDRSFPSASDGINVSIRQLT